MAKLIIEHNDFNLEIKGDKAREAYDHARKTIGANALYCSYSFSQPFNRVILQGMPQQNLCNDNASSNGANVVKGIPFFFDYTDYSITVEFRPESRPEGENGALIRTRLDEVKRTSDYHPRGGFLTAFINYQNDIGNSDLTIDYIIHGEKRSFTFSYQVLSTKLDYHTHWKRIVDDIEREYQMLAFDYLRKTYHSFTKNPEGTSTDLIWWNLFKSKHEEFIKACHLILEKPRRRVRSTIEYIRADQLKRLTPQLENQLAEHRCLENYKYRYEQNILSNDTPENRFLKYAVTTIANTFQRLSLAIRNNYSKAAGLTQEARDEIKSQEGQLNHLKNHPFFKSIGKFSGLNQESFILQRATGYSTIAQIYILLKASYSLQNGAFSLETKNIAELYEIWCFIEIRNIVKELFDQPGNKLDIEDLNRQELNGRFNRNLSTGGNSQIIFRKNGVELAELYYNSKTEITDADGIPSSVSPSGIVQKPDIVLQLSRIFLDSPMKLTYLFDAKYRLKNDESQSFDQPPDDAINQMHRYRDAIYYKDKESSALRKEVIGGYILFPGRGESTDLEAQRFYRSIKDINIGAFPLRPCDEENRKYLVEFIRKLTAEDIQQHIDKAIPQKGMTRQFDLPGELKDYTVFGTTHGQDQLDQITKLHLYILPVKAAEQQDINAENAATKKWLFIEMRPDNASSYSKIFEVEEYLGHKTINHLQELGYQSQFRHGADGYFVWKVKA